MADADSSTANTPQPPPPSKRRKLHDDDDDDDDSAHSTPRHDTPSYHASRSTSASPSRPRASSRLRSNSASPRPPAASRSPSRSPTRSRSRSRSPSRSRPRSRSRSRTRSHSRSESRSPSRSRSRSRSLSQDGAPRPRDAATRASSTSSTPPGDLDSRPRPAKPNFTPRLLLSGHQKPISQVRISPDGRWIASSSADGTIRIWDAATGRHMETLVGHMAGVSAVAWAPDSRTLASGSDDKAIRLWDRVTGRPVRTRPLLGHHNYVYCLAFSPKGNMLASGSHDEAVFLWDVRAGRLMRSLPAHSDPVSGIDFCRDGTLVVSCSTDGLTRIWDTGTGQCLRTLVHEDNPPITSVCFAPNGRFVLAFSSDSCIRLWDYVAGSVKKTYQGHVNKDYSVGGCFGAISNGGDTRPTAFIAAASEDGDVVLWDVRTKEIVQRLRAAHEGVCFWVDIRGDLLATAGQDGRIKIYRHQRPDSLLNGHANGHKTPNGSNTTTKNGDAEETDSGAMEVDGGDAEDQDFDAEVQAQLLGQAGRQRDTEMDGAEEAGSRSRSRSASHRDTATANGPSSSRGGTETPLKDEDVKRED